MVRRIQKKTVKLIELILASCALGFKYDNIYNTSCSGYLNSDALKDRAVFNDLIVCVTYIGLLFLKSMACISTISGQIPRGNYVKYFHIIGSLAYVTSEILLIRSSTIPWGPVQIFGTLITVFLIIALLLDCFNMI